MLLNRQSAWLMSFYIILFYAYQYVMLILPHIEQGNVCQTVLINGFIEIEISTAVFLLGYALAHIPIGILMDRYGPQYVVASCVLLTVLGNYIILSSNSEAVYLIGRFLIGFGAAAAVIGWFKIILLSYPRHQFVKNLGMFIFLCFLLIVGLIFTIDHLKSVVEWRVIILSLSLLGVILSLVFFIFTPRSYTQTYIEEAPHVSLKSVFMHPSILRLSVIGALIYGPLWGFCEGWGAHYFCHVYLMNEEFASVFAYLMAYGFFLGAPVFGYIIYKVEAYELGLVLCSLVIFTCFLLIKIEIFNIAGLSALLWILGFFSSGQMILFYGALRAVSAEHSALSIAIVNMSITLAMTFFHFYTGVNYKFHGHDKYMFEPMNIVIVCLFIAAIYSLLLYKSGKLRFIK